MEMEVRGTSVTIVERRSPWRADLGPEWSRFPIAKLRYDPEAAQWSLHWRDGHEHWHAYDGVEPVAYVEPLLAEMNADPRGIFWG